MRRQPWLTDALMMAVVLLSVGGFLLLTYPLLSLLTSSPSLTNLVIVQFAGAILYGTVFGVIPTLLPELFPTNVRYTGISLSIGKPGSGDSEEDIVVRIKADAPVLRPDEPTPANAVL